MVTNVCADDRRVVWKKLKYSYKFFCTECGTKWEGDKAEKILISKTHLCPKCFREVTSSEQNKEIYYKDILEENEGFRYAYRIFDSKVHMVNKILIYKIEGNKQYCKNYKISYNMGNWSWSIRPEWEPTNKWKRTYSKNWEYAFYDYRKMVHADGSKKGYLTINAPLDLKSNQKYMVMHNHLNKPMMMAIKEFDIKDVNLCYKYSGYINKEFRHMWETYNEGLNETDLKYLVSNKIHLQDYIDYIRTCKDCGIKNKHPKDFKAADDELNKIKEVKSAEVKQKKIGKKLLERFNSLPMAIGKKFEIHPYHDCMELAGDAELFHICIYRAYTDKYANGETDLYRCTENGNLIACIEVKDNRLIQVRGKYNADPKSKSTIEKLIKNQILKGDLCTDQHTVSTVVMN